MFDEGTGAEVTQRIAAPTFGGVLGTTVLALPVVQRCCCCGGLMRSMSPRA